MGLSLLRAGGEITISDADLIPGGDKTTSYTIQKLTPEKSREIRKDCTTKKMDRRSHTFIEDVDGDALQDALIDFCLKDWTNVLDDGKPVPCVLANKLRLDWERRTAILRQAGSNEIGEAADNKANSFPSPA